MIEDNKEQPSDINVLTEELNALKMGNTELQDKYNQLEEEYNTYKFDIEFNEDIKDINTKVSDNDIDILKKLKKSDNSDAYMLLIEKFKAPVLKGVATYFKDEQKSKLKSNDLFTTAIDELKGE